MNEFSRDMISWFLDNVNFFSYTSKFRIQSDETYILDKNFEEKLS